MIVRVFRARIFPHKVAEFEQFFRETALPLVKRQPGLISLTLGKPLEATSNEFLMVMIWQDLDSIKAFAGEQWQNAVVDPSEAELLESTFVDHYELMSQD